MRSIRFATLVLFLMVFSAHAKDNGWWNQEVYTLSDVRKSLNNQIKALNARQREAVKDKSRSASNAMHDVEALDFLSNPLRSLSTRIDSLASLMGMAGFSATEDRPYVLYRIEYACDSLRLREYDDHLSFIRERLKQENPKFSAEIDAATQIYDAASKKVASICKDLK